MLKILKEEPDRLFHIKVKTVKTKVLKPLLTSSLLFSLESLVLKKFTKLGNYHIKTKLNTMKVTKLTMPRAQL